MIGPGAEAGVGRVVPVLPEYSAFDRALQIQTSCDQRRSIAHRGSATRGSPGLWRNGEAGSGRPMTNDCAQASHRSALARARTTLANRTMIEAFTARAIVRGRPEPTPQTPRRLPKHVRYRCATPRRDACVERVPQSGSWVVAEGLQRSNCTITPTRPSHDAPSTDTSGLMPRSPIDGTSERYDSLASAIAGSRHIVRATGAAGPISHRSRTSKSNRRYRASVPSPYVSR